MATIISPTTGVMFDTSAFSPEAMKELNNQIKRIGKWAKRHIIDPVIKPRMKLTPEIGGPGTDVIDLSKNVIRVTPETKQTSALFNEFIEETQPSIYKAKDIKQGNIKVLGDALIPILNFSLFSGIQNGAFITDSASNFNDTTTIIPVRNIKRGVLPIQEIYIDPNKKAKDAIHFININNDTIPVKLYGLGILDTKKFILSNPLGNSLFVGDFTKMSPEQFRFVNNHLRLSPSYPIRTDLGSGDTYFTNNPSYYEYLDLFREYSSTYPNDKKVYIIGKNE